MCHILKSSSRYMGSIQESLCPYNKTHSHYRPTKVQFEFKFLKWKKKKEQHTILTSASLKSLSIFIRNDIKQQKQSLGMYHLKTVPLCQCWVEGKCPQWIYGDVKAE